ncbi:MbtH family NRPS accessory protein [Synechococcus sp. EJ6-Ellesmere]|uniref:MbtH family protein n=1 Tax=Synechococcus sp. EJ6-Ellesmere TaxID=2823734 RepID=UPI0020CD9FE1|nr:MbtH family NRPS accessory protein [Synechococcus sp. EJ6-Ellesmere]MCP9823851.1 MbtH family NRPS accessory protein [Synechococcus sp. EJ6-Ellesmere]
MSDRLSESDCREYQVVVNQEDQHSIWPVGKAIPHGWRSTGFSGVRSDCLDYIAISWTDITPKSLRSNSD